MTWDRWYCAVKSRCGFVITQLQASPRAPITWSEKQLPEVVLGLGQRRPRSCFDADPFQREDRVCLADQAYVMRSMEADPARVDFMMKRRKRGLRACREAGRAVAGFTRKRGGMGTGSAMTSSARSSARMGRSAFPTQQASSCGNTVPVPPKCILAGESGLPLRMKWRSAIGLNA